MRYSNINNLLFIKNRKKLVAKLKKKSVVIINSNDEMPRNGDQKFKFRQNSNMLYFTGIEQEKTVLILYYSRKNKIFKEILFIIEAKKELEIWEGHKLTKKEASKISGIKEIRFLNRFENTLKYIISENKNIYLADNKSFKFSKKIPSPDLRFIKYMKNLFPLHNYKQLSPIITKLRLRKEPEEIELIKKSCEITSSAFYRVLKFVKPDIKEYEIEAEITCEFIRNGANGHAYIPIVASGKNNCVLHYISNDKKCKNGDLLLMDFGAEYAGYAADITRTIPVNGKFTKRQKDVYQAVLRIMKKAVKLIKPKTTINKINKKVNKLMAKELINLKLITRKEMENKDKKQAAIMKYFMHGTSHFMGLDVHDVGTKKTKLKSGMVLSCEPGIYIEKENFGVRLENDILVTKNGQIDLLKNLTVEIDEIEKLMRT